MNRREILSQINRTLDQLIENQAALHQVTGNPLFSQEIEALQKTQESLLSHLIYLDNFLKEKGASSTQEDIYDKLSLFSELSSSLAKKVRTNYRPHRSNAVR